MVPPLRRLTFFRRQKSKQKGMPHHSVPRRGSACPHSGIAPWARREGPSMAQRGYPGIHAGMPTAQRLRSAIVVNGASKIKVQSKIKIKGKSGVRADPSLKRYIKKRRFPFQEKRRSCTSTYINRCTQTASQSSAPQTHPAPGWSPAQPPAWSAAPADRRSRSRLQP